MTTMDEQSAIAAMTAVDLPEEDFPLGRLNITLKLRGLSHGEALELQEYSREDGVTNAMYERRMLSKAMLWPQMKPKDVASWQNASPAGEIDDVMRVVMRLSGMDKEDAKNAYKSVPSEPESGE